MTLRGRSGKGGRNSEFLLALAIALQGLDGVCDFAADTDGAESNAGAFVMPDTLARMREANVDPGASLSRNDSWTAFNSGSLYVRAYRDQCE